MLSAAKHLLYLLESKQKQILRFAQNDDVLRAFFSILLEHKRLKHALAGPSFRSDAWL
jgi:hypothetical protein